MKKSLSAVAVSTVFAAAIQAAPIERILVTGSKSPITTSQFSGSVDIIDAETIRNAQAISVVELLQGVAGIAISQSGGLGALSEIRMRGSESNHTVVMLNGVPVNDLGQGDLANLTHLAINSIERIEIIKGGQSALWGTGAIGGVINIVTNDGSVDNTDVLATIGENNQANIQLNHQKKVGKHQLSLGVSHVSSEGENFATAGDERDGYRNNNLTGRGVFNLSPHTKIDLNLHITNSTNHFDSDTDYDGQLNDTAQFTDVEQHQAQIKVSHQSDFLTQTVSLNQNKQTSTTFNGIDLSGEASSDVKTLSWLGHKTLNDRHHLNVQVEYQTQDFANAGPVVFGDPNQQRDNVIISKIVDGLIALTPNINLTASFRHDDNDIYDHSTSYNLGSKVTVASNASVYASVSKAVKNPSFTETFGYFPASFIGNPNLKPEHAQSLEVGATYSLETWQFDVSLYRSTLQDEILTQFNADFTSTSVNSSGNSEREGVELSVNGNLFGWDLYSSYGYNDSSQGNVAEARRPKNVGQLRLQRKVLDGKGNVFLQANHQGSQLDTNFGSFAQVTLDSYTLFNASFTYSLNTTTDVIIKGFNLFDEDYQDVFGYQGRGRNLSLGVRYSL